MTLGMLGAANSETALLEQVFTVLASLAESTAHTQRRVASALLLFPSERNAVRAAAALSDLP